jgi:hypothetical protein
VIRADCEAIRDVVGAVSDSGRMRLPRNSLWRVLIVLQTGGSVYHEAPFGRH